VRCAFAKFKPSRGLPFGLLSQTKDTQISDVYEVKSTLFMMGLLKDSQLQKRMSDLQRVGTQRTTYLEILSGIVEARAYLEEIKSKASRRDACLFQKRVSYAACRSREGVK
jgi:hypothetical protein